MMEGSETKPVKSLDELWCWQPSNDTSSLLPLAKRNRNTYRLTASVEEKGKVYDFVKNSANKQSPKVMLCHDMKGGYIEDRLDEGCYELTEEPYRFIHWSLVDIFVYFSHHLITIPPIGWIQAAHKNGVEILGTIITEFDDGKKICDELLQSRETIDSFVNICCKIAVCYKLEGWLLNIENKLDPDQVPNMMYLVQTLTDEMHLKVGKGTKVIWYDSVTHDGELKWQNALNENNYRYFDSCDGIYLNYGWRVKPEINDLDDSVEFLQEHEGNVDRITDIYVGIDVFGRGCYGGGGFACNEALGQISKERRGKQLSVAIFAPGWTHETRPKTNVTQLDNPFAEETFSEREFKFWTLLGKYLSFRGLSFDQIQERTSPKLLFTTNFDSGSGLMRSIALKKNDRNSKKAKNPSWFLDLANQDVLPTLFTHSSKFMNENQSNIDISRPFNIYPSNDVQQNVNFSQVDDDNSMFGSKSSPLLVIDSLSSNNTNWMFCNRVFAIPLFLTDINVEHKNLLFNIGITSPFQGKNEENSMSISSQLKPCLIIRYGGKKKNKSFQKTVKLSPYFKGKRRSLHTSDDSSEADKIAEMMADINIDPNNVQYLFDTDRLKSQSGTKLINISAILIEIPIGQKMININSFSIYGE